MIAYGEGKQFLIEGKSCTLFDDQEKACEVNSDKLLIPWWGDRSILIDRFDGRGYLTEVCEENPDCDLKYEDYLSEEEVAIEKMCDFERYLEMQVDVHELAIQDGFFWAATCNTSLKKLGNVNLRNLVILMQLLVFLTMKMLLMEMVTDHPVIKKTSGELSNDEQQTEEPYVCPPELQQFLSNVQLPEFDKQAHIIEKTAVFVARQGSQMEIVLKAKQHNNPLFGFLNYDHSLNPFYKEIVRLISKGRYIPKPRQTVDKPTGTLFTHTNESNKSIHEDVYELKLPKVDISNTPYASLISKFKKINETAAAIAAANRTNVISDIQSPVATPDAVTETERPPSSSGEVDINAQISSEVDDKPSDFEKVKTPSPQSDHQPEVVLTCENPDDVSVGTLDNTKSELIDPLSPEEYERIYQEYYKHYYAHYYTHYSNQWAICGQIKDEQVNIVQEAAKAAAIAAAAAVNVVQQTRLKASTPVIFEPPMNDEQRGIINKMAEYVVRNGLEFEELVSRQKSKDPRFAFLKSDHPLYSYYMAKRKELDPDDSLTKAADANFNDIPPPRSPKSRSSKKTDSIDKAEESSFGPKSKNDSYKKSKSPDSHKETKSSSQTHNSERQTSISFRLSRPPPPSKSHSHQNNEASAEEIMDIIEAAVQEYSESISSSNEIKNNSTGHQVFEKMMLN
ncbi:unnamed protein product [Heterobilharzia americana]|nr:unnamed protein product [Heterobilharzia americana]